MSDLRLRIYIFGMLMGALLVSVALLDVLAADGDRGILNWIGRLLVFYPIVAIPGVVVFVSMYMFAIQKAVRLDR